MAKTEWTLVCGEIQKTIKADENSIPIEVATVIVEKNFVKLFTNKKKTAKIGVISVLSKQNESYVFPTDLIFANAGLYNHAELIKKARISLTNELNKKIPKQN